MPVAICANCGRAYFYPAMTDDLLPWCSHCRPDLLSEPAKEMQREIATGESRILKKFGGSTKEAGKEEGDA